MMISPFLHEALLTIDRTLSTCPLYSTPSYHLLDSVMPISNGKSRRKCDMRLAERTLRLLLDPLVETGEVVMVHTLDLGHLLTLHDTIQANRTILISQVTHDFPLNPIPVGPHVFLPK
jgi:hypothetical protein